MYFQFLIEDRSTEVLVGHVMRKIQEKYSDSDIYYDVKSFKGLGHLSTKGTLMERKSGNLLNDLGMYLRGFDKSLADMENASIIIVLDNDERDYEIFKTQLENVARDIVHFVDYAFCISVKEMEAWLLGDRNAVLKAYPLAREKILDAYKQDGICDTWEVLANAIYPDGLSGLRKKAKNSYTEIGKAKSEWADKIGDKLTLENNISPSFQNFIGALKYRIERA